MVAPISSQSKVVTKGTTNHAQSCLHPFSRVRLANSQNKQTSKAVRSNTMLTPISPSNLACIQVPLPHCCCWCHQAQSSAPALLPRSPVYCDSEHTALTPYAVIAGQPLGASAERAGEEQAPAEQVHGTLRGQQPAGPPEPSAEAPREQGDKEDHSLTKKRARKDVNHWRERAT